MVIVLYLGRNIRLLQFYDMCWNNFQFPLVRDKADCLSSGRLREVKKQLKIASASCERRSLMRGGHFCGSSTYSIFDSETFGILEKKSLTRGGRKGRFGYWRVWTGSPEKILEEIHATVCKKEGEDHKTVSISAIFSALNQYPTEKE